MSFAKYKEKVENGDTVMLYLGFDNMHTFVVKDGVTFQIRYGALKHSDLIGVRYGSRVHCKKGYLYVLYPTPEFWTMNLPHRTQIVYSTDISLVTLQLDLRPGSIVVESGTGSASLSHALIRTVAPTGHLHTFEFHEQRAKIAKEEFEQHGLSQYVTVTHRDVCQDGFQLDHVADAVFLDLPRPWEAIISSKQALKSEGGRLCSFSPCIEQAQRTCETLTQNGFVELKTYECLLRNYDVRTINLPIADLGPSESPAASESNDGTGKELKFEKESTKDIEIKATEEEDSDKNREAEEVHVSKVKIESSDQDSAVQMKNEDGSREDVNTDCMSDFKTEIPNEEVGKKRTREDNVENPKRQKAEKAKIRNTRHDYDLIGKKDDRSFFFKTAAPSVQMPGHTGFMTFATLYPL